VKVLRILTLLILVSRLLPAQSSAPPLATGTITGHVYLGDSHLPARMAYVVLLSVGAAEAGDKKSTGGFALVQTGLDGAFVMPNVLPGSYYLIGMKRGYSLPAPDLNGDYENLDKAPQDVKDALTVVVTANRVTTANIVLSRGAVIAGTVRFDDGEPATEAKVSLLRKDKSGKWAKSQDSADSGNSTDDEGNFRITNLSPGEYLLRTTLVLSGAEVRIPGMDSPNDPDYHWDIYFGDGIRPRDAKTIKLKDGEESNGNIIEIPLARLHSISGTVLSEETGAPISRADVELHNADDDSTCTVTAINPTAGQFHFPYVAEGEYTLKVTNASDIFPGKGDQKPIRTYGDASQSLIVKGETSGVTIQVKPLPVAAVTAAQ
jgi:protocatechuate 3,4-dioxygenase beta subunit